MPDLDAPLSREEFEALHNIGRGPLQPLTSEAIRQRLLDLGYIQQEPGTLHLTNLGKLRLQQGK